MLDRHCEPDSDQIDCFISEVKKGNHEYFEEIAKRYSRMIKWLLVDIDVPASELEDLYQEGLIGLYQAVMSYKKECASFTTFAYVCIKRSLYSALRKYYSKKNMPLRTFLSLSDPESYDCSLDFVISKLYFSEHAQPESVLISKETIAMILKKTDDVLSDFEKQVLKLYLRGLSYETIAHLLKKTPKSIDNAIQRTKNKLRLLFD